MKNLLTETIQAFELNAQAAYDLMNFDRLILKVSISQISDLNERIKKKFNPTNPLYTADRTIDLLQNIREHDSLKIKYHTIINQCVVLLVSYFGTSVKEIFTKSLIYALSGPQAENIKRQEIKLTLGELQEKEFDLKDSIGSIVANKSDISFQDMQSIQRTFTEYFQFCPKKDNHVDNIIFAQACRHIIVHNGSKIDDKMIRQLSAAKSRDIKPNLVIGSAISFSDHEVHVIGESMVTYLHELVNGIERSLLSQHVNVGGAQIIKQS